MGYIWALAPPPPLMRPSHSFRWAALVVVAAAAAAASRCYSCSIPVFFLEKNYSDGFVQF